MSEKLPEAEIAQRRLTLALVEIGACITDIGNLILQGPSASKMKRGGVVIGLQRAMLAIQNKSFTDLMRDPQLQATEFGSNHVYMDPVLDLVAMMREFITYVPEGTPLKEQVTEILAQIDTTTQVEVEQENGITIRSYRICEFTYTNWKGEVEQRKVRPIKFYHGSTEWYPKPGWLMQALDLDKDQRRDFSMPNMSNVVFS